MTPEELNQVQSAFIAAAVDVGHECLAPHGAEHEVPIAEDQVALGGGEQPEVEQVGVAAGLHPNVRRRRMGQIPRHRCRGSAEVRELGRRHPAMADLDHVRQAALLLLLRLMRGCTKLAQLLPNSD